MVTIAVYLPELSAIAETGVDVLLWNGSTAVDILGDALTPVTVFIEGSPVLTPYWQATISQTLDPDVSYFAEIRIDGVFSSSGYLLLSNSIVINEPISNANIAAAVLAAMNATPPGVNVASLGSGVAAAIAAAIDTGTVTLISPYDPQTQVLTLVRKADYKTGSLFGPLSFLITRDDVVAGDVIRFGATLASQDSIQATGVVVDVAGDLFARVELTKETHTNRKASECWKWELEHIDSSGNVTPLIVDQPMILKPSHAG